MNVIVLTISVISSLAFCYANLSGLLQFIFNKNFYETIFKKKWQLDSYSSYALYVIGLSNFINEIFINNVDIYACINIAFMISSHWYLFMLIRNYFRK